MFLNTILVVLSDLAAHFLGNTLVRQHFHLWLSGVVVFGPVLSLWVSPHSIFAKRTHFLYRVFLRSGWGWTCIFVGSFVFLLSFSIRRSISLSIRHLTRLVLAGGLWLGFCKLLDLLENATGSCYEPLVSGPDVTNGPLLVLREGESKAECLRAGMLWRGYEVSEDVFLLCLCCMLLVEETAVFGPYLTLGGVSDAPLRILFMFCVLLLGLWIFLLLCLLAYFPQFPTQLIGGALGCLSWRVLYQGWYRLGPSWYCPGRPGLGLLNTKTCSSPEPENKQVNQDHCNEVKDKDH
ncbi:fat storage-inducing transmembrane protein 1 [Sphaeramia orbicularis]|uniref:Fat storage-inducing transmembrane protein 1 homolog n=1 Tax=Sphaeramia orbicularis TaxID=375764 RepID=A0A673AWL4_9TELE|nr:fat storage-inducing transmembrane protein 1-like [Sphaeramia orbicularis]XP_030016808.1 fat storage-inducing transmembrane protein 1-like [Sphaeramia orbicularis]